MGLATYEIDGRDFDSLDAFFDLFTQKILRGAGWGRNWDAFEDVLRGGFGTPEGGFILVWKNHEISKRRMGLANFWQVVNIIQNHGPGGHEGGDGVHLRLE